VLFAARCSLPAARCSLLAARCSLPAARRLLRSVACARVNDVADPVLKQLRTGHSGWLQSRVTVPQTEVDVSYTDTHTALHLVAPIRSIPLMDKPPKLLINRQTGSVMPYVIHYLHTYQSRRISHHRNAPTASQMRRRLPGLRCLLAAGLAGKRLDFGSRRWQWLVALAVRYVGILVIALSPLGCRIPAKTKPRPKRRQLCTS